MRKKQKKSNFNTNRTVSFDTSFDFLSQASEKILTFIIIPSCGTSIKWIGKHVDKSFMGGKREGKDNTYKEI